jgi:hypothetical protein
MFSVRYEQDFRIDCGTRIVYVTWKSILASRRHLCRTEMQIPFAVRIACV